MYFKNLLFVLYNIIIFTALNIESDYDIDCIEAIGYLDEHEHVMRMKTDSLRELLSFTKQEMYKDQDRGYFRVTTTYIRKAVFNTEER